MKLKFSILLFMIYQLSGWAQEFATPDSKWAFDYAGGWATGITEVQYEKDTLIEGQITRKLSKKAFRRRTFDGLSSSFDLNPVFICSNAGVITFSEDAIIFDTLINYKANIGQSWKIYRHYNSKKTDSIEITVLDTFRTKISGHDIFTQSAKYVSPKWSDFIDTVYEYIGVKWLYILPFDDKDVAVDRGEGGIIRCFKNESLGIVSFDNLQYGSDYKYNCDHLSTTENELNEKSSIHIHSNLINEFLQVENNSDKNSLLILINLVGQTVSKEIVRKGMQQINLSTLNNGIYYLSSGGKIIVKIIKY